MILKPCFNGWNDHEHNKEGACCCNCAHQRTIVKHPGNKEEWSKGPCSNMMGWGCAAPDFCPHITFMDREHSMCECHTERDYEKYSQDYLMDTLKDEK